MFFAIAIASVLDANLRAKTFWRMGVLVPYVVAPVAVSLVFGQLFADESGGLNAVLTNLGLDPIGWHSDRSGRTWRSRRWSTSAGRATTP